MFARAPLTWGQLLAVLLVGVVIVYLLIAALSPGYVVGHRHEQDLGAVHRPRGHP